MCEGQIRSHLKVFVLTSPPYADPTSPIILTADETFMKSRHLIYALLAIPIVMVILN